MKKFFGATRQLPAMPEHQAPLGSEALSCVVWEIACRHESDRHREALFQHLVRGLLARDPSLDHAARDAHAYAYTRSRRELEFQGILLDGPESKASNVFEAMMNAHGKSEILRMQKSRDGEPIPPFEQEDTPIHPQIAERLLADKVAITLSDFEGAFRLDKYIHESKLSFVRKRIPSIVEDVYTWQIRHRSGQPTEPMPDHALRAFEGFIREVADSQKFMMIDEDELGQQFETAVCGLQWRIQSIINHRVKELSLALQAETSTPDTAVPAVFCKPCEPQFWQGKINEAGRLPGSGSRSV